MKGWFWARREGGDAQEVEMGFSHGVHSPGGERKTGPAPCQGHTLRRQMCSSYDFGEDGWLGSTWDNHWNLRCRLNPWYLMRSRILKADEGIPVIMNKDKKDPGSFSQWSKSIMNGISVWAIVQRKTRVVLVDKGSASGN